MLGTVSLVFVQISCVDYNDNLISTGYNDNLIIVAPNSGTNGVVVNSFDCILLRVPFGQDRCILYLHVTS